MKSTLRVPAVLFAAAILFGVPASHAGSNELLVSNVQAAMAPQTASVDVWYSLETVDGGPVTVSLSLSTDSGATYPHLCETVSGDIGDGVLPGIGKHIVWNAGADFPGLSSATCRLRVTADDGQVETPAGFVAVSPGTFMMGSPISELDRQTNETQHQVTLTHGLYVQTTEVTNQQYRDLVQWAYDRGYVTATSDTLRDNLDGSTRVLMSLGPRNGELAFSAGVFSCANPSYPVKYASWFGSAAYCDWLSLQEGLPRAYNHGTWQCNAGNPYTATGYRLPTEAEWEYACRAGTQTPFHTGDCLDAGTEANYYGPGPYPGCPAGPDLGWTMPVGSYPPNAFGLHDMHGNLWEWCNDRYGPYGGTVTDPVGAVAGSGRVFRGGDWGNRAQYCRSAMRSSDYPYQLGYWLGFRVVRSTS